MMLRAYPGLFRNLPHTVIGSTTHIQLLDLCFPPINLLSERFCNV